MPVDTDEDILNLYETVPKKFKEEERHYDTEKQVNIKLPFRMCVTGASGSGKTNAVISVLRKINGFDKIMIWAKDTEEPLYASFIDEVRQVEKKTGTSILTVSNTITDLPPLESINKENNTLLIIDDMVTEKDKALAKVSEYFIRGRKKYISSIFISQSYFDIPLIIRKNSSYFIFTKISGERDLNSILKDYKLGISDEEIMKLYTQATSGGFPNFFMIDLATNDKNLRFRRNFKPLTPPEGTMDKAVSKKGVPVETKSADTKTNKKRKTSDELSEEGKQPKRTGLNDKEAIKKQLEESKQAEKEKREYKLRQDKFNLHIDKEYAKLQAEEARLEREENKAKAKLLEQHIKEHEKEIERQRKEYEKHPFNQPEKMEFENPEDFRRVGDTMEVEDEMGGRIKKRKRKTSSHKKFKSGTGLDAELKALIQLVRI